MVKEPHPGRVKTRLGAGLGMTRAAWWFRHQSADLLRRVESPRWQTILAVSPAHEGLTSRVWPVHIPRIAQGSGDLGARMRRIFQRLPPGPTLIIGADIPGITRTQIGSAFRALGKNDAVFGPASDGGFWLVGLKRNRPVPNSMFAPVRWSSEYALSDTLATIPGRSYSLIQTLDDVDTLADLPGTP